MNEKSVSVPRHCAVRLAKVPSSANDLSSPSISVAASLFHSAFFACASTVAILTALCLLLPGCAVGPNYRRPNIDLPAQFRGAPELSGTNLLSELPWWDFFKEARLKELVRTALTNNYDVRIAATRVQQARYLAEQNRALFLPQANYQGNVGRGKNGTGTTAVDDNGRIASLFLAAGSASWEADLWGRVRRLNEASRARFFASEEARRDVTISLISQVAQSYFRLLSLDAELEIARRSTNSFGESLRIFSQRLEQGVVSKLESAAAEAALASAAATVPELERQVILEENLLSVLLGQNPGEISRTNIFAQEDLSLTIPPGLPSDLLRRRPDIREAEQLLHSANAQVGVAMADFFPRLSLTALFGQVSPELSAFTSGGANAWSVAANTTGPIFEGGRLRAVYRQAKAARDEAELHYKAVILNALQEVSDDLVSVQKLGEERVQQARAVRAYEVAVQVAMERYIAGRASYYEVLQEQQLLFPAERALVEIKLSQLTAFLQLYRALGGGFPLPDQNRTNDHQ
jgi:multidrug efflux system outer membrane protein